MRIKKDSFFRNKWNNSGSTLIVVLVAVSFLVILASVIMTVSSAGLRMKQLEYVTKQNFYVDETGLEDIYNGIGRDVSNLVSTAYSKTLLRANAGEYISQKAAYVAFVSNLKEGLEGLYGKETSDSNANKDSEMITTLGLLNSYISRTNSEEETIAVESFGGIKITKDPEAGAAMRQYTLQAVKIKYTKAEYESVITTDIVIEVPYINFFQDFSEVLDYCLIGNEGIYFKQRGNIEGNVYAGIDSSSENATYAGYYYAAGSVYDGINFYQADVTFHNSSYIISRGDFNICRSNVTIEDTSNIGATQEYQTNLWVENIRTVEEGRTYSVIGGTDSSASSFSAKANIYVADDLELNAQGSNVKLSGNYYGYNYNNSGGEGSYETYEYQNLNGKYSNGASHTTSSSIVINANHSTLDLTGLNTLMVAGTAYLDIRKDVSYSSLADASASEYRTGESIAMRYNQFLYLAPSDILDEDISNPQKNGTTSVWEACSKDKLSGWFGNAYIDANEPIIPVVFEDNGISYTYYYLNIVSGLEEDYITAVMSATDSGDTGTEAEKQKWKLKQEILNRADSTSISSHILVTSGGESSDIKIYTEGLLTDTGEEARTIRTNTISKDVMALNSTNMQKHYMQLYVKLDSNSVDAITDAERNDNQYPLAAFLNMNKFTSDKLPNKAVEVEGVSGAKVWLYGTDVAIDVSADTARGIVLCKGDVTIRGNGGTFEGLIVATGKIIVEGNITIKANSGVVQAILEEEQRTVLETAEDKVDDIKIENYASNYFLNTVLAALTTNLTTDDIIDTTTRIVSTDYTDYIYYDNWKRGEVSATE